MSGLPEPPWLVRARDRIGIREIPGREHNPEILRWWRVCHLPFTDDETSYCSAFVGAMLEDCGLRSTRLPNARSWEAWGMDVLELGREMIPLGAVVVYDRPPIAWHGHVGFAVGITRNGNIMTIGANQSNTVSIAPFKAERLVAARWMPGDRENLQLLRRIPFVEENKPVSTVEA
jgi:uncharacterized protein (TIGR02594 family)